MTSSLYGHRDATPRLVHDLRTLSRRMDGALGRHDDMRHTNNRTSFFVYKDALNPNRTATTDYESANENYDRFGGRFAAKHTEVEVRAQKVGARSYEVSYIRVSIGRNFLRLAIDAGRAVSVTMSAPSTGWAGDFHTVVEHLVSYYLDKEARSAKIFLRRTGPVVELLSSGYGADILLRIWRIQHLYTRMGLPQSKTVPLIQPPASYNTVLETLKNTYSTLAALLKAQKKAFDLIHNKKASTSTAWVTWCKDRCY